MLYMTALNILIAVPAEHAVPDRAAPPRRPRRSCSSGTGRPSSAADRAATLAVRDPRIVCRTLMVLGAGMSADKLNLDAFMAQAMEYEAWDDPQRPRPALLLRDRPHPPAGRPARLRGHEVGAERRVRSHPARRVPHPRPGDRTSARRRATRSSSTPSASARSSARWARTSPRSAPRWAAWPSRWPTGSAPAAVAAGSSSRLRPAIARAGAPPASRHQPADARAAGRPTPSFGPVVPVLRVNGAPRGYSAQYSPHSRRDVDECDETRPAFRGAALARPRVAVRPPRRRTPHVPCARARPAIHPRAHSPRLVPRTSIDKADSLRYIVIHRRIRQHRREA